MRRAIIALAAVLMIATVWFFKRPKTQLAPALAKKDAVSRKGQSFSDVACADTYLKLFDKPVLDVRVIFGYKDARPARFVDDRYEEMIFIQRITGECKNGREDCGFTQPQTGPSSDTVFLKTLQGPDGEPKTIKLSLAHSSVSPDDDENRKNPFQTWQTESARHAFIDALKTADVVFYNGHSRSGGGPDFAPPLMDEHGHVKYAFYKKRATSLLAMEKTLRASRDSNLQLLGLFSCASEQLFTQKILRAKPGLGLISSHQLLYFSDALEASLISLSALLEMRCRPEWSGLFETSTDLKGFWQDGADSN